MGVKTIARYVIKPLTYSTVLPCMIVVYVMTTALVRDTAPSQPTSRYHSTSKRQNVSLIRYVCCGEKYWCGIGKFPTSFCFL